MPLDGKRIFSFCHLYNAHNIKRLVEASLVFYEGINGSERTGEGITKGSKKRHYVSDRFKCRGQAEHLVQIRAVCQTLQYILGIEVVIVIRMN